MENTLSTGPNQYLSLPARLSLKHVPNVLTIGRIIAAPIFGVLLLRAGGEPDWRAGLVFAAAAITDQIDGCLARRWQAESRFGALADPLADKLIIGTAIVVLAHVHRISEWPLLLLLARQAALWGARLWARSRYGFPVSRLAKVSAWVLYVALGVIIVTGPAAAWPQWVLWAGISLALAEVAPYGNVIRRNWRAAPRKHAAAGTECPMDEGLVEVGGRRKLAYCVFGPRGGLPVFLSHGWGECRLTVPPDHEILAELGIRLITIDRPGIGRSDPQPGRRLLDWPSNVAAVADHLGVASFAVLGRSAGAAYAAACAYRLPGRVISATLVSGVGPPSNGGWKLLAKSDFRKLILWLRFARPLARPTLWVGVRLVRPHLARLLDRHVVGLPDSDRQVLADAGMRAMRLSSLREAFAQAEVGIHQDAVVLTRPWGFDPGLITTPVRVWHGTADTIVNVGFGHQLCAAVRHSRSFFATDAGHYLLYTHWREILEKIVEDSGGAPAGQPSRGPASLARVEGGEPV